MTLDFAACQTTWLGASVPFHPKGYFCNKNKLHQLLEHDSVCATIAESYSASHAHVKDAVYNVHDPTKVAAIQTHLTVAQRAKLATVFTKRSLLFSGRIGCYTKRQFHIELKPGTVPYHVKRPYHISVYDIPAYKREMERQESIGVLKRCWETKWGMPGFVRPKKDGTIRTIEDLRELNKCVVREVYPLPRIQDILHRRQNYQYLTKIDILMQYYTFMLDEESSWYVIIVTPMGKWHRIRVPMGFLGSTDWAQATMEEIFQDVLDDVELYINDIGIFDTDWSKHIAMIDLVLTRLEENGFTVNPLKCEWGVKETDWLSHWLTPTGPMPW
jgi:hypothetical protein